MPMSANPTSKEAFDVFWPRRQLATSGSVFRIAHSTCDLRVAGLRSSYSRPVPLSRKDPLMGRLEESSRLAPRLDAQDSSGGSTQKRLIAPRARRGSAIANEGPLALARIAFDWSMRKVGECHPNPRPSQV
jgi:hypothetical protein